ncbi:hypothetical protein [Streptomyces sp. NPDC048710]|uniref:hypothetical protein n=1 Tax=Streptomyces sp. NPDC048710 TaxID=3365586 RepID=UPI0037247B0F
MPATREIAATSALYRAASSGIRASSANAPASASVAAVTARAGADQAADPVERKLRPHGDDAERQVGGDPREP